MKTPITPRLLSAIKAKSILILHTGYDPEKTQLLRKALRELILASMTGMVDPENQFIKEWLFQVEQDTDRGKSRLWHDLRKFYVDAGFAEPYDQNKFTQTQLANMGGMKSMVWFKFHNINYTFKKFQQGY